MTSRERIRQAINFERPDRVPIDIGGTKVTGIHIDLYCELVRYIGLDLLPAKLYEQFQMLARPDYLMMKWLNTDVIQVENVIETWGLKNEAWKIWRTSVGNDVLVPERFNPVKDENGTWNLISEDDTVVASMAPEGLYFDRNCPTGMTGDFIHMDPDEWKRSIPLYSDEELKILRKRAKFLHEYTDYSIHGGFLKGGLGTNGIFAGHTICDWLCILSMDPAYANEILKATAERTVENLTLYLQAVGSHIDTILISGTDFGTQRGELFNPEIFRTLHLPNYKRINDYVHKTSAAKTMFHSCGSIMNIIEYFIQAGVDILNPVHTNTTNMEPKLLAEKFGGRIVFWGGGVETQTVLPNGTPEEVAAQVKERLKIFGTNGGFVFAPVHNLQYGVPCENIEEMINTILKYGNYPMAE